jgi:putative peptide zinc metalloprotease protein
MNLSEAFDAALPELPKARLSRKQPPCLDPELIVRETTLDGEPSLAVYQRSRANFFRFPPAQWELVLLFDGVRSFQEIADAYTESTGVPLAAEDVRSFAASMDSLDFWYKSPQEKNIALNEKLMAQRSRRAQQKSKLNLAHISFSAWDPDHYLTFLDEKIGRYVFSDWCTTAVVLLFLFEAVVFAVKWNVIGPDIPLYYSFTNKGLTDLAEFWILFLLIGFVHESAHGLTCKHYGGEVHSMGLMFLYLTPAFYVDVTESWISGNRSQRLATIIAGIWIEMVLCGIAILVWTSTLPGDWLHDFCYKIILLTGIAVVAINMNPLIKLDGYYFLTEFIGIPDLKERSTAFLTGWVQRHLFRLRVEVPVVPRRRIALFVAYAFLSGAYSYLLLLTVVRFTYNISYRWLADFAIIPAGALLFAVFRSRLRSLFAFTLEFFRQRREDWGGLQPSHAVAIGVIAFVLFVPLWRDREAAYFTVEPGRTATLNSASPGKVMKVLVAEGQQVSEGQPLALLTSDTVSSLRASSAEQTALAKFHAFDAEVRRQSVAGSSAEITGANRLSELAQASSGELLLTAPWTGVVTTEDPASLLGRSFGSGQSVITVADKSRLRVRLYIPALELMHIPLPAEVSLMPAGAFRPVRMRLVSIDGEAANLPPGILTAQSYGGISAPTFYSARVELPPSTALIMGMSGEAIIFGKRQSVAMRIASSAWSLVRGRLW